MPHARRKSCPSNWPAASNRRSAAEPGAASADDESVRVACVVPSYYVKQLVTQAALQAVGSQPVRLQLDVEVASPPPIPADEAMDYAV